jgi:hypothetical protein
MEATANTKTTTKAPEDVAYTTTGEAFGPVTEHTDHWGKNPEAPVPETVEGLHDHLQQVAGDIGEASDLAEAVITYAPTSVEPLLWAIEGQASRAEKRLNEVTDALHNGHTENVGHRLEDVGTMVLHLESVTQLALNKHSQCEDNTEMVAGVLCNISNAIEYTRKRLDFLVYESDLPLD